MKFKYTKDTLAPIVAQSFTFAEVIRSLKRVPSGCNYKTIQWHCKQFDISTNHFTGQASNKNKSLGPHPRIESAAYFAKNTPHSSVHVKNRLYKEKLKKRICEICSLTEWLNKPIVLQIDHIDGDKFNNDLTNLRILCPNCHSQTATFAGKGKSKYGLVGELVYPTDSKSVASTTVDIVSSNLTQPTTLKVAEQLSKCVDCDKTISDGRFRCKKCAGLNQAPKINWPTITILLQKLENQSFVSVAKEIGVSDNAIRKHLRSRNIVLPKRQPKLK